MQLGHARHAKDCVIGQLAGNADEAHKRIAELESRIGELESALREVADWLDEGSPEETAPCSHCIRELLGEGDE